MKKQIILITAIFMILILVSYTSALTLTNVTISGIQYGNLNIDFSIHFNLIEIQSGYVYMEGINYTKNGNSFYIDSYNFTKTDTTKTSDLFPKFSEDGNVKRISTLFEETSINITFDADCNTINDIQITNSSGYFEKSINYKCQNNKITMRLNSTNNEKIYIIDNDIDLMGDVPDRAFINNEEETLKNYIDANLKQKWGYTNIELRDYKKHNGIIYLTLELDGNTRKWILAENDFNIIK